LAAMYEFKAGSSFHKSAAHLARKNAAKPDGISGAVPGTS
jgi:hypothetical protein